MYLDQRYQEMADVQTSVSAVGWAVQVGIGVGLYYWFSYQWIVFGDLVYTFIGEPEDRNLRNRTTVDAGVGYRPSLIWLHSLMLENRTAVSAFSKDATALVYSPRYRFRDNQDWYASLEYGLSNGAPDFSVGIGLRVLF